MNSVEEACSAIAEKMVAAADAVEWHRLELHAKVFGSMVSSELTVLCAGAIDESKYVKSILDSVITLRDENLRTTGQRIWGLTFTLYPDGKYDIAYDYNKPADYDDSEEAGGTINASPVADLLGGLVDVPQANRAESFLQQAMVALKAQTAHNTETWGLGTEVQWNLDMNAGSLHFTFADGRKLSAAVQVVGTYNTDNDSFLWGWDHPSVPEPLRRAARLVREYGQAQGIEAFTTRTTGCTEADAWSFAAVAAQLDGAAGAYRGDAGGTWIYMVFEEPITLV